MPSVPSDFTMMVIGRCPEPSSVSCRTATKVDWLLLDPDRARLDTVAPFQYKEAACVAMVDKEYCIDSLLTDLMVGIITIYRDY